MRLAALSFTGFSHELIEEGGSAIHRMTPLMDYGNLLNVMSDREVAAVYLIYQELVRDKPPVIEINFVHHGGDTPRIYARHFGCPVNFDRPFNEIVLAADFLNTTISDTSKESAELCIQQCELLISQLSKQSSLVDDVRHLLHHGDAKGCILEMVDDPFGITGRPGGIHQGENTILIRNRACSQR